MNSDNEKNLRTELSAESYSSPTRDKTPLTANRNTSAFEVFHDAQSKSMYDGSNDRSIQKPKKRRHEQSRWMRIKKHLKSFCETTSLRGVPRIVKTNDPKRKTLWTFFVTVFFLACVVCTALLVIQYRQFDVIHQPRTVYNQSRLFPSLSVCNLRPLSTDSLIMLRKAGLHSVTAYLESLMKSMSVFKNQVSKIERKLLTMSWNMNSYLLNLPSSVNPSDLGHDRLQMVLMCVLIYKEGIYSSGISCENAGRWISTLNSVFLTCHTFIVDEKYSNRTFNMEVVLYLDTPDDVHCPDCQEMMIASQLSGVRLNLHSSGTYPEIIEKGINLMPGTLTEIKFIPREWSMMEPPHGKCSRSIKEIFRFDDIDFEYSEDACKKKVLQEELVKNCGCIDFNQVPDNLVEYLRKKKICKFLELPPYSNISVKSLTHEQIQDYFKTTLCELKTQSEINYQLTKCYSPCTYYTYDTTISSAEWPTKSYHTAFLKSVDRFIERRFRVHQNASNITKASWGRITDNLKPYLKLMDKINKGDNVTKNKLLLNSFDFVQKNFLSIQVNRHNFDIVRVEEKAVISLTNLLSQAGGMFSIWSGITFVCIVEIVELIILIFDDTTSRRPRDDKGSNTV